MPPQLFTARLEDKIVFSEKHTQFSFELVQPHELRFMAGQYVSVQVSERGDRRSYSIASSPAITHGFDLLVEILPGGIGSQMFNKMSFGDEIKMVAPMGNFTIAQNNGEEAIIMLATGSGIAPFMAMLSDLLQVKRDPRPIQLIWGMRYANQLFWLDEFRELVQNFPNFSFQPVISRPIPEWTLSTGRVTDILKLGKFPANAGYYLCGNAAMLAESLQILTAHGVEQSKIHYEKFT